MFQEIGDKEFKEAYYLYPRNPPQRNLKAAVLFSAGKNGTIEAPCGSR
jgi:hypothetical protein